MDAVRSTATSWWSSAARSCPCKGTTTRYWSIGVDGSLRPDLAWCYDHPVAAAVSIAGAVAFYNEKVDIMLYRTPRTRPSTHFFEV